VKTCGVIFGRAPVYRRRAWNIGIGGRQTAGMGVRATFMRAFAGRRGGAGGMAISPIAYQRQRVTCPIIAAACLAASLRTPVAYQAAGILGIATLTLTNSAAFCLLAGCGRTVLCGGACCRARRATWFRTNACMTISIPETTTACAAACLVPAYTYPASPLYAHTPPHTACSAPRTTYLPPSLLPVSA